MSSETEGDRRRARGMSPEPVCRLLKTALTHPLSRFGPAGHPDRGKGRAPENFPAVWVRWAGEIGKPSRSSTPAASVRAPAPNRGGSERPVERGFRAGPGALGEILEKGSDREAPGNVG